MFIFQVFPNVLNLGKVLPTWESYKIERNAPKKVGALGHKSR